MTREAVAASGGGNQRRGGESAPRNPVARAVRGLSGSMKRASSAIAVAEAPRGDPSGGNGEASGERGLAAVSSVRRAEAADVRASVDRTGGEAGTPAERARKAAAWAREGPVTAASGPARQARWRAARAWTRLASRSRS